MPLTVSTKCPSCGGGLEFEEGTTSVQCRYCGSSHVVTGHGRVLSYYIPDKIPADIAVAHALMRLKEDGQEGFRAMEATLFFVPFYRFVGQALCWEAVKQEARDGERPKHFLMTEVRASVFGGFGGMVLDDILEEALGGTAPVPSGIKEVEYEFSGRRIDRSMPAVDAPGLGMASLGIKPEVLKLSLFDKDAVAKRGRIVPVTAPYAEKERFGFKMEGEGQMAAKALFDKSASIIYYPLWVVEVARGVGGEDGRFLAVVDGVSGEVARKDAPVTLLDALLAKDGHEYSVLGLRPLKCPNCATDLPVKPNDLVFFCGGCRKAWYISGEEFIGVPYRTVPPVIKKDMPPEYFPFWVVRAKAVSGTLTVDNKYDIVKLAPGTSLVREQDKDIPLRFFVPAFRIGNLKSLERLSAAFTRNQPVIGEGEEKSVSEPRGCALSPEDALAIAPLVIFSIVPKGNNRALAFAREANVEVMGAELVLFPFFPGRMEYTDGLYGWALPSGAIRE